MGPHETACKGDTVMLYKKFKLKIKQKKSIISILNVLLIEMQIIHNLKSIILASDDTPSPLKGLPKIVKPHALKATSTVTMSDESDKVEKVKKVYNQK